MRNLPTCGHCKHSKEKAPGVCSCQHPENSLLILQNQSAYALCALKVDEELAFEKKEKTN